MLTRCFQITCALVILVAVYFPSRHARYYEYIHIKNVLEEIAFSQERSPLKNCSYQEVILKNTEVPIDEIFKPKTFVMPLAGGAFVPQNCKSSIKTAIIVPYRNRPQQLSVFLNYIHSFLQNQNIEYRIFVVEQNNSLPFNRAQMLNYGASVAIKFKYPCLILHDVDLIPLCTGNLYACSLRPRHMSSSLDTFRYNLPYLTLFGGAIAILSDQYKLVNGMSNKFYGWGGEDDNFYNRLERHHLVPYRFDPEISRYTMLVHKKQAKNSKRFELLDNARNDNDGLSDLRRKYSVVKDDLITRIVVF